MLLFFLSLSLCCQSFSFIFNFTSRIIAKLSNNEQKTGVQMHLILSKYSSSMCMNDACTSFRFRIVSTIYLRSRLFLLAVTRLDQWESLKNSSMFLLFFNVCVCVSWFLLLDLLTYQLLIGPNIFENNLTATTNQWIEHAKNEMKKKEQTTAKLRWAVGIIKCRHFWNVTIFILFLWSN